MENVLIKDVCELYELLEKKYGKRFISSPLLAMTGRIEGTLDSKKFVISYDADNFLLISTAPNCSDVLTTLQPLLTEVMKNQEPICSYDLQTKGTEENDAMPTIEWDIKEPEKRIKEIVNGRAFSDESKLNNLKLFGNREIKNYIESEEEKEERLKNARIYGIDPGCIKDVESINNLSEVDLYFAIDAMGGHIWRCQHDASHGRIPPVDLTEENYALEYMSYQTTKFGVELNEPEIDKHITPTPSYNAWYNFYNNHFKHVLTDEQFQKFLDEKRKGNDVSAYMPTGFWADSLKNHPQKQKKANATNNN